jgi:hypothetical protein
LDLAEKKNRAYRQEMHQAAKDFGHIANLHASEYAARRREDIFKRAVDIDYGKGIGAIGPSSLPRGRTALDVGADVQVTGVDALALWFKEEL